MMHRGFAYTHYRLECFRFWCRSSLQDQQFHRPSFSAVLRRATHQSTGIYFQSNRGSLIEDGRHMTTDILRKNKSSASALGRAEHKDGLSEDAADFDEENSEDVLRQPWKTLLEAPARAAWRVTDPHPPSQLILAIETILRDGNRTPKQLKRAHRKVLEIQSNLAEFRERERRRLVNGKYYRGKDAIEEGTIHPVYYGYDQTLAALQHRMLPNYAITKRVLEECHSLLGSEAFDPRRVIDFGIGCGSASAAVMDLFPASVEWIHGIDASQPMRDCAQRLIEGMADKSQAPPRVTFSTGLSSDTSPSSASADTGSGGSFDLALFAYSATDLPDITSTLAAAALLFEKLKPNGVLVMIEPGTPDGFNSIRAVRNMLLDCCPPNDPEFEWRERCHIIAPCTHNGPCPMVRHKKDFVKKGKLGYDLPQHDFEGEELEGNAVEEHLRDSKIDNDREIGVKVAFGNSSETEAFNSSFCSFVQTMPGSDSRKGEKFSYLVAQKRIFQEQKSPSNHSFPNDNVTHLLAMAHNATSQQDAAAVQQIFEQAQDLESRYLQSDEDELGLELLRGEEKRESMGRIIRAPIKKKGHLYIDFCTSPGRIIRSRVAKSSNDVAPGIWTAARKSRWGGFWPNT